MHQKTFRSVLPPASHVRKRTLTSTYKSLADSSDCSSPVFSGKLLSFSEHGLGASGFVVSGLMMHCSLDFQRFVGTSSDIKNEVQPSKRTPRLVMQFVTLRQLFMEP